VHDKSETKGQAVALAADESRAFTIMRTRVSTFYTVSDKNYFLGTVTLLNSLRVAGNSGELCVINAGLEPWQERLLSEYATVLNPPTKVVHPFLWKQTASFFEPTETIVLIDSDMIVTASLDDVVSCATKGSICAYPDEPYTRWRWFPEWEERLQLRSPLRRDACVNAGFLAFSIDHWPDLLRRWWEVCQLIELSDITPDGPFQAGDQDALNALLMSEVSRERLEVLPEYEARLGVKVGSTIQIDDFATLRCSAHGQTVKILHFTDRPKPWERSGWTRLAASDYVRLMRRLLFEDDLEFRFDPRLVPLWLRPSAAGEATLSVLSAANRGFISVASSLPDPVVERLRRLRRATV
jgi:lipopolysaccharide biosynthesis glycosyltransferase